MTFPPKVMFLRQHFPSLGALLRLASPCSPGFWPPLASPLTLMSLLHKSTIKVIAESLGIAALSDDIASAMAPDVEYRVREVVQEATKFAAHSHRERLTTDDINHALRLKNVEPLYGFSSGAPLRFQRVQGVPDLFYLEDEEVDLASVISAPLVKCPLDITFSVHWLAVDGVQPAIPQNPAPPAPAPAPASSSSPEKKRSTEGLIDAPVEVKPMVKHVLSRELQLYFEKVTSAVKGSDTALKDAALKSVSEDPGIHQLVPYFTQFVADEVTRNLRNLPVLVSLVRMMRCLLTNSHIHTELYLHQLMPCILTCLVGRNLSAFPSENHWALRDTSAELVGMVCRRYGTAYRNLQPRITKTLLHAFLDPQRPLTTHYGAIVGLSVLGHRVVHLLLLPNVTAYYWKVLEPQLHAEDAVRQMEARMCHGALLKVTGRFLCEHAGPFLELLTGKGQEDADGSMDLRSLREMFPDFTKRYEELYSIFGEALLPYISGTCGEGGASGNGVGLEMVL